MMQTIFSFFNKLAKISEKRVDEYGARYIAFGIFSSVNYLVPMYMWTMHSSSPSVYTVRVMAIVLSFMLVSIDVFITHVYLYVRVYLCLWLRVYFVCMVSLRFRVNIA